MCILVFRESLELSGEELVAGGVNIGRLDASLSILAMIVIHKKGSSENRSLLIQGNSESGHPFLA